jgi:hypothetical protein
MMVGDHTFSEECRCTMSAQNLALQRRQGFSWCAGSGPRRVALQGFSAYSCCGKQVESAFAVVDGMRAPDWFAPSRGVTDSAHGFMLEQLKLATRRQRLARVR